MSAAAPLRFERVSHRYGKTVALHPLDLQIPAGRLVGFIGPDGVGKSTLLALVTGAKRLQAGEIHVLGGDMADAEHRRQVCPRIDFMPQGLGRNLYPTLTVRENLDFFARLFGTRMSGRADRVDHLLAATGLAPFPDRPVEKRFSRQYWMSKRERICSW